MTERRFRVSWAEAAVGDLEEIVSYIAHDSPMNARKVLSRLTKRGEALKTSPHHGRIVPELALLGVRTYRELVVKPYRIIYRVVGSAGLVLVVYDGRRDLEDVLLERLVRCR